MPCLKNTASVFSDFSCKRMTSDVIAEVHGRHDVVLVLLSDVYCRIIKFLNWSAMKRRIPVGSLSGLNFVIQTVSSLQNFENFLKNVDL